ncbi:class I SAM-dependent methyltransferase [Parvularcula sp. LCG005]|uniref:class I SAM-dependent methyltransferase n=1 Tax=Parvularcula sp. LCG005 TaxID=3078805 RepID=UPI00294258B7|nr:methyltransferase domain-containing protein [Parvularcula sp. LCG005]WOI53392.1 methyltransferase domain-containing protein [Parvularcula sp. LCG005]
MAATSKDTKFWDKIAPKYFRQPIGDQSVYDEKIRRTQALMTPDMDVLEFGCGTGMTAVRHGPKVRHILATDISESMVEFGRQRAAEAGVTNVTFQQATLDDLSESVGTYDMVLGLSILHLMGDADRTIEQVGRLLKTGGYFVSSTTCLGDEMPLFRVIIPIMQLIGKAPTVRYLKKDDLIQSLKRAGFDIVDAWLPKKGAALFVIAKKR